MLLSLANIHLHIFALLSDLDIVLYWFSFWHFELTNKIDLRISPRLLRCYASE